MCSGDQCREFKGWCKSFTVLEKVLTVLETILLVLLIVLLVIGIIHFFECGANRRTDLTDVTPSTSTDTPVHTQSKQTYYTGDETQTEPSRPGNRTDKDITSNDTNKTDDVFTPRPVPPIDYSEETDETEETGDGEYSTKLDSDIEDSKGGDQITANIYTVEPGSDEQSPDQNHITKPGGTIDDGIDTTEQGGNDSTKTKGPKPKCTWKPFYKTSAVTHYYEGYGSTVSHNDLTIMSYVNDIHIDHPPESDGDIIDDYYKGHALALVKMEQPYKTLTLGCILTIISEYWTVTAASCIDSIEEVDSLDAFVMMELDHGDHGDRGARSGPTHSIVNVLFHPRYQGVNKTYDVAVLKSADKLRYNPVSGPSLPTMFDYFFLVIGEKLNLLGFGKFRSLENGSFPRPLRRVPVFALPSSQCSPGVYVRGLLRHLSRGHPVRDKPCSNAHPICAGALYGRRTLCSYCAGTPLYRGHILLGIMSENENCGVTCEPNNYVSVAITVDWLRSVIKL